MRKLSLFIALSIISIVLASCGGKTDQLIPLENGNLWIYNYQRFNPDGTVAESNKFTLCALTDSSINYEKYFMIEAGNLWTNRADGLYAFVEGEDPLLLFKYPAEKGAIFSNKMSDSMVVASTSSKAETPAGTFDCYEYHLPTQSNVGALTIAKIKPGVGIVEISDYNRSFESDSLILISRLQLDYYKLLN
jgi:hypothetical protein